MISTLLLTGLLTFPLLSVSIGHVESGMNPLAVGKAHEQGAFQVRAKYWGKVPNGIRGQMAQHDAILRELLEACGQDVMTATERYNGSGRKAKQYARKVRQRSLELAILETL